MARGYVEHRARRLPPASSLPECPVETCSLVVASKWRPLILRDLIEGPKRFGELQRSVSGISQKMLTSNLRGLEEQGIVVRRVYPEMPPHVEYVLSDLGMSLVPVIEAMRTWGERYQQLAREE